MANLDEPKVSAAEKVLGTTELLEMILLSAFEFTKQEREEQKFQLTRPALKSKVDMIMTTQSMALVFRSQRVNRKFQATIMGSIRLRRKLWMEEVPAVFLSENHKYEINPIFGCGLLLSTHRKWRELPPFTDYIREIEPAMSKGPYLECSMNESKITSFPHGSWREMIVAKSRDGSHDLNIWCDGERTGKWQEGGRICKMQFAQESTAGEVVDFVVEKYGWHTTEMESSEVSKAGFITAQPDLEFSADQRSHRFLRDWSVKPKET